MYAHFFSSMCTDGALSTKQNLLWVLLSCELIHTRLIQIGKLSKMIFMRGEGDIFWEEKDEKGKGEREKILFNFFIRVFLYISVDLNLRMAIYAGVFH